MLSPFLEASLDVSNKTLEWAKIGHPCKYRVMLRYQPDYFLCLTFLIGIIIRRGGGMRHLVLSS